MPRVWHLTVSLLFCNCTHRRGALFGYARIHCAQRYDHCAFVPLYYLRLRLAYEFEHHEQRVGNRRGRGTGILWFLQWLRWLVWDRRLQAPCSHVSTFPISLLGSFTYAKKGKKNLTSNGCTQHHSGFYNNFLATLPYIKEHIIPLLAADQPPRTLYVVGHSLGGGVATVASCYFLLQFDWTNLPHRFVGVTAGAPRSCATSMKNVIDERLQALGESAKMHRLVKDKDVVTKVPPTFLAFQHLVPPVCIEENGEIRLKEAEFVDTDGDAKIEELRDLVISPASEDEEEKKSESETTRYEKWIGRVPKSLRDHMPEL